ncbi:MAG: MBL fold metallo-hydrolase [Bacteroidetes bacterium]|nr:MBL fold metallo-hydrolase [Bacteroidota bacterium]
MNESKICATCGTKYPANFLGENCLICEDDRQYVPLDGQKWTTSENLYRNHSVKIKQLNPNLFELVIDPVFAIGQRALLVVSESGNILWDCIPHLDENAIRFIQEKGGLKAIAISHPHYYSNMNDWAEQFDCPIFLPESEKNFIVNPTDRITFWREEKVDFWDGIELIRIGGHFPGSSILWLPKANGKGIILCGDTFNLALSLKHFSVMYSYPNRIPLPINEIEIIKEKMQTIEFDETYGFWPYQNLLTDPKKVLMESLERYK